MKKKQLFDTRRKVPFSPIVDKDAICDSDGTPLDALYATKTELKSGLAAKQNALKAGNGISIKDDVISSTFITPITYAELVALRNSASLIAGMQYRITDYDFTTTEEDTDSAHKLFDIIVTADSESALNENARAVHHQYAKGEKDSLLSRDIASWELKYTIENIKHSSSNGKGTVLWMKDEYRNECNYDFINALFKIYKITACAKLPSLVGNYAIKTEGSDITYGTDSKLVSTFDSKNHDNIIKYDGLAKIVLGVSCYCNTFSYGCHSNTLKYGCHSNIFGNNCYSNIFGNDCHDNTFGTSCYSNIFGNDCHDNTFGTSCYSNTFGNSCYSNIFGNDCYSNTFGNSCYSNTFGEKCHDNAFGGSCYSNTFENGCRSNTFSFGCSGNILGGSCYFNTFGDRCASNTFGGSCTSNTFGEKCIGNTIGEGCRCIKFASDRSATTKYNYYRYNHFGDGCQYILLKGAETASYSAEVKNYNFAQGLQGDSSAYLEIDGVRSRDYETKVAKNSSGELKIYCEADLIQ